MYFVHIPKTGGMSISRALDSTCEFEHKTVSDSEFKSGIPVITCVRDPYTRMISMYKFFRHYPVELPDTFKEFVLQYETIKDKHIVYKKQVDYIYYPDGSCPITDFIKFENLSKDWSNLCKKYKFENTLKHLNGGGRKKIVFEYDDDMIRVMEKVFAEDLKLWRSL